MLTKARLLSAVLFSLLLSCLPAVRGAEFYVAPNVKTEGDGSFDSPWSNISEALSSLRAGDTLYLRGGTYFEADIPVSLKGSKNSKIVIRSYPGERAKIVSRDLELIDGFDKPWVLIDPKKSMYKTGIQTEEPCMAWLTTKGGLLWRYSEREDFAAEQSSGRYCGPGIFQQNNEVYLRIEADKSANLTSNGDELNRLSVEEYRKDLQVANGESVFLMEGCDHVEISGIDFHGGNFACVELSGNSSSVAFSDCYFRFHVYGLTVQDNCSDIQIANCKLDNGFPDGARWGDIKIGDPPPLEQFNSCAMSIEDAQRVIVKDCCFLRCFQGMFLGGNELTVKDNKFLRPHEAILISPTTTAEISGNVILHALEAFSIVGGTDGRKAGKVYMHHNVVDLSSMRFVERTGNFGEFNREQTTGWDFIGSHDCDDSSEEAVFAIYNNTIIGGGDSGDNGWNSNGTPLRSGFKNHIECNNIFISFGKDLLERAVGKSAGNVFWQSIGTVAINKRHGIVINPRIDSTKWLNLDAESTSIEALRECFMPANQAVHSNGVSLSSYNWPGSKNLSYLGAVPRK